MNQMILQKSYCCKTLLKSQKPLGLAAYFSTSTPSRQKVAELRQYSVKPDKVAALDKLFTKYVDTRYKYSKATGFWKAEFGTAINKLVSIWEYDNLSQRAAIRQALTKDEAWVTEFLPSAMSCLVVQENSTMYPAPWCESIISNQGINKGSGIYELNTVSMNPGGTNVWEDNLIAYVNKMNTNDGCNLVGVWYNDIGNTDDVFIMWRYENYEAKLKVKENLTTNEDVVKSFMSSYTARHSMVLLPCPWSPLK